MTVTVPVEHETTAASFSQAVSRMNSAINRWTEEFRKAQQKQLEMLARAEMERRRRLGE